MSLKLTPFAILFTGAFLSGCAQEVGVGQRVFITPSDSAHLSQCKMLGQVEVDASINMLWDGNQQVLEIKNRLRDRTAELYPTADTVSHSDLNVGRFGSPDANVMGTAFDCFD